MQSDKKLRLAVGAGLLLCLTAVLLSLCLGSITISPADIVDILAGGGEGVSAGILRFSRLPRTCACVLAGIGLSVSGAVLQNVLSNKLASPSIIGVNAGAGLGVTLCCAAGALSGWAVSASAFAGSLMAIMVILMFTYRTGASKTTVILVGVAMNSMLNAFSESVTVLFPDVAALNMEFRVGGFSGVSSSRLTPAAVLIGGSLFCCSPCSTSSISSPLATRWQRAWVFRLKNTVFCFLSLPPLWRAQPLALPGCSVLSA